jgi:NADH-dependent peroxiredoxin subunit F
MLDLIIIGGGPAGASAGVYAARKRLKTVLVTKEWGGQSIVSDNIENWIGSPRISGQQLAENLRKHVESYAGDSLSVAFPDTAVSLRNEKDSVTVTLASGKKYDAQAALITAGAARRKLEIPGAAEYDQKGLTYCATCDGPLYEGKDVAVIGGGNAAFETAAQLLAYCKTVTLVTRGDTYRADEITVKAVLAHPNVRVIKNANPTAVIGGKFVTGLKYTDSAKDTKETLLVEGIFVEIGLLPNTAWLSDSVTLNKIGQIVTDPRTQQASVIGAETSRVWAAGDCTDGKYHQNNIASGDAVKALEDIYLFIKSS